MLDGQDTKSTVSSGNFADSTKLQEADYRRIVTQLYNEIAAKDARLKGVQALTIMLHESEEKGRRMEDTAKNYEMTLRRAEARIAQLNKIHGIGPQTAFNRGVVLPGVSRKDFELLTKENLNLKEALSHIVPTNLSGHEVILKNQELYTLVSRLGDDLSQRERHIKELESALKIREDGGISAIPDLTRKLMKLDRSLNAKQVFCEALIKENEKLKKLMDEVRDNSEERDDIDGRKQETDTSKAQLENAALKETIDEVKEECRILNGRREEAESIISDFKEKLKIVENQNEKLNQQGSEMKREKEQENQRRAAVEKEVNEMKKKCDGFFQQVISLNSKQKESEDELERMKRAFEHQGEELGEKKSMIHLMTESLKSYEDDFRHENEEKAKIQKVLDKAQQETERTKRENQSHMATIQHLEDEFERMNKLLNEERKKSNDYKKYDPRVGFDGGNRNRNQAFATDSTRSLFQNRPMQVVADGDGIDESSGNRKPDQLSMPTTKSESSNAPSLIECPYCSRSYPYHLIEGHVQDCMEDSLYMDERD